MQFEYSAKVKELQQRLIAFMDEHIYPNEQLMEEQIESGDRWQPVPLIEQLKPKARAARLWNLFLPDKEFGAGLTNLEYAPLCEIMGRSTFAPEVFNCSAPDTGNMEVLAQYGTPAQQDRWLRPLLAGEIRSCFAMTEPDVASSDATNIQSSIVPQRRRIRDQRSQMVELGRRRSPLQDYDLHGQDESPGQSAPTAVDDPGAE